MRLKNPLTSDEVGTRDSNIKSIAAIKYRGSDVFNDLQKQHDFIHDYRENSTHLVYSRV